MLRWLAIDGLGFHEGFFHSQRYHRERDVPGRLAEPVRRVFDQGLGRSLWFVEGADVGRIAAAVGEFAEPRRADLWSGVGLACAYAGGVDMDEVARLFDASSPHGGHFAQGVAFATAARQRGEIQVEHTEATCRFVWQRAAEEVATAVERARSAPATRTGESEYEGWRRAIRGAFELEVRHAQPA
jgi:hypothetical protein